MSEPFTPEWHNELDQLSKRRDALIAELRSVRDALEQMERQRYGAATGYHLAARTINVLRLSVFEGDVGELDLADPATARRITDFATAAEFLREPNCGRKTVRDIDQFLQAHGLRLRR